MRDETLRATVYRVQRRGLVLAPDSHGLAKPPQDFFDVRRLELFYDTVLWRLSEEGIAPQRGFLQMSYRADRYIALLAFVLELPTGFPPVDVDHVARHGGEFHIPEPRDLRVWHEGDAL